MPSIHGEKAVIRILGQGEALSLCLLGLESQSLEKINQFLNNIHSSLFLCGPTGSGKTTTAYAVLDELKQKNLNIVSVEDPVEIELEGVCQTNIDKTSGLNFPLALKTLLRHDPDVIFIGEVRDKETAEIMLDASNTGHKLISTIHASNVFEALQRFLNLSIESKLDLGLSIFICQHLLPSLCATCKVIDLEASNQLGYRTYKEVGCGICDYTGFKGQQLLSESLALKPNDIVSFKNKDQIQLRDLKTDKDLNYHSPSHKLKNLLQSGSISAKQYQSYIAIGSID